MSRPVTSQQVAAAKALGEVVRRERIACGMVRQADLVRASGCSAQFVWTVERGRFSGHAGSVVRLGRALGLSGAAGAELLALALQASGVVGLDEADRSWLGGIVAAAARGAPPEPLVVERCQRGVLVPVWRLRRACGSDQVFRLWCAELSDAERWALSEQLAVPVWSPIPDGTLAGDVVRKLARRPSAKTDARLWRVVLAAIGSGMSRGKALRVAAFKARRFGFQWPSGRVIRDRLHAMDAALPSWRNAAAGWWRRSAS
jgi:hypothetical protein